MRASGGAQSGARAQTGARVGAGSVVVAGRPGATTARGFAEVLGARVQGATAGVVTRGGQTVFASSLPPQGVVGSRGASGRAGSGASAIAGRNSVGDLWSGFGSAARGSSGGSISAAAAAPGQGGVPAVALAALGLGFGGILATAGVAVARRRRAEAGASASAGGSGSIGV